MTCQLITSHASTNVFTTEPCGSSQRPGASLLCLTQTQRGWLADKGFVCVAIGLPLRPVLELGARVMRVAL